MRRYKPSYLYIKTHNLTGLKYFGKTCESNPHRYKGSGTEWMKHLDVYGYDVTTELLNDGKPYENIDDFIRDALEFSNSHNIVNAVDDFGNKIWANLVVESGLGGAPWSPDQKEKLSVKRKGNGNPQWGKPAPNRGVKRPGVGGRKKGTTWSSTERESQAQIRGTPEYKKKMRQVFSDPVRNNKISNTQRGKPGTSTGKHWFNNGLIERYSEYHIDGWTRGRLPRSGIKRGIHWFNNGVVNRQFFDNNIEEGFRRGRLSNKK